MAPLTADTVRSLASFSGTGGPVVSLYLDVDGQRYIRPQDYEAQLDHLLRRLDGDGVRLGQDVRRITGVVRGGVDRSKVRGLAVFSCAPDNFFEVVELSIPVRNQIAVNQRPNLLQLEGLLERSLRFGVLVVDRQRARLLVFQAGELRDKSELFDRLPRHDDDRGDWDRDHVRDHAAAAALQHARRAAQAVFTLHQQRPLDHLILAGAEPALHEVERELHSYLRDRVEARLRLATTASDDEIRAAVAPVEAAVDERRTAALVGRLRDGIGAAGASLLGLPRPNAPAAPIGAGSGSGVAGLAQVLRVLYEHRVETLLVSDGFEAPGWRCRRCGYLATVGPSCPLCSDDDGQASAMDRIGDVVEEAIQAALNQSVKVAVCTGNADLDVLGRIGALLRF